MGREKWEKTILELMEAVDANVLLLLREVDKLFAMPIEGYGTAFEDCPATVDVRRVERGKVKVGEEMEIVGVPADGEAG